MDATQHPEPRTPTPDARMTPAVAEPDASRTSTEDEESDGGRELHLPAPGPDRTARSADRYRRILGRSLSAPFVEGNRIRRLKNGKEIFPTMLDAIRKAERSVEFETFVYWTGDIAVEMAETLAATARRGVEVRVLLDAAGCLPMDPDIRDIMEDSPVEVRDFGPLQPWRFWELDHRTHRKILVCDGIVGFTGGVGIAEEWEGDARNPDEWRETHFQVEGPAVQGLRGSFLEHWLSVQDSRDGLPAALPDALGDPSAPLEDGPSAVQVVPSTAAGRWSNAQTLFRALLQSAQDTLRITTGYFTPEDELVGLLTDAAARGVRVDVLHPGKHIDHRVSQLAGEQLYPELLEAGVHLWRYQKTMIHAKLIMVDGVLSCIGSANLNYRSVVKDDEIALVVLDPDLTGKLEADFDQDLEHAERVRPEDAGSDRPLWRRVLSGLASLGRREL